MSSASSRAIAHLGRVANLDCLPFLYCTPTIISSYTSRKPNPNIPRSRFGFIRHHVRRQHSLHRRSDSAIPFEGIDDYQLEDTEKPDSTLTQEERIAFANLKRQDPVGSEDDGVVSVGEVLQKPYDDLYAMFDTAIEKQETPKIRGENQRDINILRFEGKQHTTVPKLLETVSHLGEFSAARLKVQDGKIVRDREQFQDTSKTSRICKEHLKQTRDALRAAASDVEIWNVLEQEVFSIVRAFNARLDEEQKLHVPKKKKKPRKHHVQDMDKGSTSVNEEVDTTLEYQAETESTTHATAREHSALDTDTMLAIIQGNYAQLNLMALRLWRRRFATTPYTLQILPHVKSLGNISYVLGASTGMYNEVLFVKWMQYHDLHGIADLILEMINQGLGANQLTFQLLTSIERTRTKDLAGQRGKVLQSWWILRGIKEASIRLRVIYKQLEQDVGKPMEVNYTYLQNALDVQHSKETVGFDRIPGT